MKRTSVKLGVFVLVMLVGFSGLVYWSAPNHNINRRTFEKIRPGMSREEIERLVGCPPGAYDKDGIERKPTTLMTRWKTGDNEEWVPIGVGQVPAECFSGLYWIGDSCGFRVHVDANNIAVSTDFFVVEQNSIFSRMRSWVTSL